MADSLLDMGSIAQFAQNNARNAISLAQLDQQREGMEIRRQEMEFEGRRAAHQQFKDLYEFSKDPRVTGNPELEDSIFDMMGKISGAPQINAESSRLSRESRRKFFSGMVKGSKQEAEDGFIEMAVRSTPEGLDKLIESTSAFQQTREKVEAIKAHRELESAKYQQLQDSLVKVEEGHPRYTATSTDFRDALRGTDTGKFERVLTQVEKLTPKGQKGSTNIGALFGKDDFPQLFGGKSDQIATIAGKKQQEFKDLALYSTKLLEDSESGGQGMSTASKAALRERIALGNELAESYGTLAAWGDDPFNREKFRAAQKAGRVIEDKRLSMEKLRASNNDATVRLKQEAMTFRESEAEKKTQQGLAEDYAQVQFKHYLTQGFDENQAAVQAGKDANKKFPGIPYNAEKLKTSKPLVQMNTTDTASNVMAKKQSEGLLETYDQLKFAPSLLANIEKAKVLIPSAQMFMGPGGESVMEAAKFMNSYLGVDINVEGIKSAEELRSRIFFNIIDSLKKLDAQPTQKQQDALQDSLGKLGTDPRALGNILDAYGDVLRQKIDVHNANVTQAKKKGVEFIYDPTIATVGKQSHTVKPQGGKQAHPQSGSYGNRPDGTPKGLGYFGEIQSPTNHGEFSTELTIGVNLGGKETNIPLITPNLSRYEIEMVMRGKESKEIINKAVEHAKARMKQGKSPYAGGDEVRSLPPWKPKEFESFYNSLKDGEMYTDPNGVQKWKNRRPN